MSENSSTFMCIRTSVLILLCCQNAGHALLTRYSQGILKESYSSTEVVLVGEFIKLVVSGYLTLSDKAETDAQGAGVLKIVWLIINSRKVIVLVILYSIANIVSYFALARVDASVYTVLLQLKIFTTAFFAIFMLDRNISACKWRALLVLVLGCILVASPTFNKPPTCDLALLSDKEDTSATDSIIGVLAVLVMVTISGYSACYFEQMLKKQGETVTIWERNFQLAFYSLFLLLGIMWWEIFSQPSIEGQSQVEAFIPFQGWTINTVLIALIQAGGGLLVAATLKYADAILKTLATSGSIVLSAVLGKVLLGGTLDIFVAIGCVATIVGIFNYTLDDTEKNKI